MKLLNTLHMMLTCCLLAACTGGKLEEKGFSVSQSSESSEDDKVDGLAKDSLTFKTRPGSVLLTGIPQYRLTTVYKVNYDKNKKSFTGSNDFLSNYTELGSTNGNQWNYNFMPGLEAAYGYNMVNVSHYDTKTQRQKSFFPEPVLVKTLYYPAFSNDTLNYEPVKRNYYMVSVYDEDTNKDGFINVKDLRRFYYFDINAESKKPLVPRNYSVVSSQYDPGNDFMYVFAQLDVNENGKGEAEEDTHVFWIDLKNPDYTGRQY